MDVEDHEAKAALFDGFAQVAKALSTGRRVELIDVLEQDERHVEEPAAEIVPSVANTSFHLRALAAAGLVRTRHDGNRIHYRLTSPQVGALWAALREVAIAHHDDRQLSGLPDDLEVVAYCRGPFCVYADEAVRRLTASGRQARRLENGFRQWREPGLPIASGVGVGGR